MADPAGPPFRIVDTRRPFRGKVLTVRTDRIADDDGRTGEREVIEHNGAVAALVVDDDGRVVLVDQWRHAVGARLLEIAAGKYDVEGEAVEDALRRELAEELGVEGGTLTFLASFYTTPGWSDEVLDLYLAEGVTPIQGGGPRATGRSRASRWCACPSRRQWRGPPARPATPRPWSPSACTGSSWPGAGPRTRPTGRHRTPRPAGPPPARTEATEPAGRPARGTRVS